MPTARRRGRLRALAYTVVAACLLPAVAAPAAKADVPWPYSFMPLIDGYQGFQGQTTCENSAKPGVIYLRDYLNFWYGQHTSGISRACSVGGTSEHKEGRALDYMTYTDTATPTRIVNDLLATDEHGNQHAKARRMGLMYIIYNRRIFKMYQASAGWQTYTGSNPHTDHIHFSFAWPGARKQTSWWTTTQRSRSAACSGRAVTVEFWHFSSGYGPLAQVKKITDGSSVWDTQAELRGAPWRTVSNGTVYNATQPVSILSPASVRKSTGTCALSLN